MLIAHISDLHARAEGAPPHPLSEVNAALHKGFAALHALDPRPDLFILTGDVADEGESAAYALVAEGLRGLKRPVVAVPGNHDDEVEFAEFLRLIGGNSAVPAPPACSMRDFAGLRVIGLASNLPLTSAGGLGDDVLDWLDAVLGDAPTRPTLIALHHPPFRCGIGFMDRIRLVEGAARLECVVAAHPQVLALLCGHHHRPMETLFGGRACLVAPSIAYQVGFDMRPGREGGAVAEPAAFRLLHYDGRRLVSHLAYVEDFRAVAASGRALPGRVAPPVADALGEARPSFMP